MGLQRQLLHWRRVPPARPEKSGPDSKPPKPSLKAESKATKSVTAEAKKKRRSKARDTSKATHNTTKARNNTKKSRLRDYRRHGGQSGGDLRRLIEDARKELDRAKKTVEIHETTLARLLADAALTDTDAGDANGPLTDAGSTSDTPAIQQGPACWWEFSKP